MYLWSLFRFIFDNGGRESEDSANDYTTDVWIHVALVYDVTSRQMIGYENGVEVAREDQPPTGEQIYEDDGRFVIGKYYSRYNDDDYASITVDDLMFYDRPLSEDEIRAISTFYS